MTKKLTDYFVGDLRTLLLTGLIISLLVASGLFISGLYRSVEQYRVQFDNVDRLNEGDKVILKGLEVGTVTDLRLNDEKKVLATISVGRNIKLTKGSTFTIHSDILGQRHVEINLGDNVELLDIEEIQNGFIQPPDTTGFRKLTAQERDSLVKHDPIYRLADTVMTILRKSKDSTKVER